MRRLETTRLLHRYLYLILALGVVSFARAGDPPALGEVEPDPAGSRRGPPAVIDAEDLQFDQPTQTAHGKGNVLIRYRGVVLRADRVRYSMQTNEVWAEGNVRLNRDGQEWICPALHYNFDTHDFEADRLGGFFDPLYLGGYDLEQASSNEYRAGRVTATTCDYDTPHYHLQATRSVIFPNDRVVMYNVTLRLRDVPVFWFPVVIWSLDEDFQPLTVSVGSGSRWGYYLLVGVHWQLSDRVKLTVHLDGRTRRGFGTGIDLDYQLGEHGRGEFKSYYTEDSDPTDDVDELLGKDLPRDRYRVQLRHTQQKLPYNVELKLDLNKQSDPDVVDDFFGSEFVSELEPQSVLDLTRRGPNHAVSILARGQLNDFYAESQRLPEATWAVNRLRVGPTPLFYEQESRVGYLDNERGDTVDPLFTGHALRAHTFHQFLMPARLFGWLSVVPRAGIGGTYYSAAPASSEDGEHTNRAFHALGMETSFKISRTWNDVRHGRLKIDGMRHIIEPFANYHFVPRPDNAPSEAYQFDAVRHVTLDNGEMLSLTRYSPLEFPAFNTIDSIDKIHVVRFGLRQKLQTRRAAQPWDLLELEGWTDWRVEREEDEDEFSDLFGRARMRLFEWLALDSFGRYDMNDGRVREFNAAMRVVDRERWSVGVGTRWLRHDSNLVSFSATARLGRHWVAQTFHRVDLEDGVWETQEYVLRQETHDWLFTYGVRYDGERLQDDELFAFFAVTLKAVPELGLSVGRLGLGGD
jgi:LPS-assembly protein